MGGGRIADGRADGTAENGIHAVLVFDYTTPIHVVVTYEDGNDYVLQPLLVSVLAKALPWIDIPWNCLPFKVPRVKVVRRLNAEGHMVWSRPDQGLVATLERIGGPTVQKALQETAAQPEIDPRLRRWVLAALARLETP